MYNHRTPNELLYVFTIRLRNGEHITEAQVYKETTSREWFDFSMTGIKCKTPEMEILMKNIRELQYRETDSKFKASPRNDDKTKCIADVKGLSHEPLAKYNKRKERIEGLMGKPWIGWDL